MKISKYSNFKRALILHGFGTNPDEGFYRNMKLSLSNIGIDVEIPLLPNSSDPNDVDQASSIRDKFDIVIAHSFGSVTALRYAEGHKIDRLILISGFIDTNFHEGDPDIENLKNSSTWKFNFKKIISNCKSINILYPFKDSSVTYNQTKDLSKNLKSKILRFKEEVDHACGENEDHLIKLVIKLIGEDI